MISQNSSALKYRYYTQRETKGIPTSDVIAAQHVCLLLYIHDVPTGVLHVYVKHMVCYIHDIQVYVEHM